MDERLIDDDSLPPTRRSVLPGTGFFYPDSLDERRARQRVERALDGADTVVLADPDADGLACVALLREALGEDRPDPDPFLRALQEDSPDAADDADAGDASEPDDGSETAVETVLDSAPAAADARETEPSVALVPTGPHDFPDRLATVADLLEPGVDVVVCDLCPDEAADLDALPAVVERAGRVRWFDHHQWDPELAATVRAAGVDLVVGDSDEECTADVARRSLAADLDGHLGELARVTRDHDLWIREDPRSDDLADLSYWCDPETYVAVVRTHGPDLPERAREYLAARRERKADLVARATERAEFHEVGEYTVAVTYGRCSQNEVAEALRERGADAAAVVKPAGAASLRGTERFQRCHEVAALLGGGGHPKAAGCKPDVYDDMLDYAHHWTTRGAVARRTILAAFEDVVDP
jgi:oligoribonuclease NrnB/cAMP/cGMP phosphodiesterase (DHH superfamily)